MLCRVRPRKNCRSQSSGRSLTSEPSPSVRCAASRKRRWAATCNTLGRTHRRASRGVRPRRNGASTAVSSPFTCHLESRIQRGHHATMYKESSRESTVTVGCCCLVLCSTLLTRATSLEGSASTPSPHGVAAYGSGLRLWGRAVRRRAGISSGSSIGRRRSTETGAHAQTVTCRRITSSSRRRASRRDFACCSCGAAGTPMLTIPCSGRWMRTISDERRSGQRFQQSSPERSRQDNAAAATGHQAHRSRDQCGIERDVSRRVAHSAHRERRRLDGTGREPSRLAP